ncbi:Acetylxylan esterase [Purpureocillium takamizusanense]|uniref:Acetylxylan esterase n=1 Tax=Purpureocillium takamizusanense TaxID=2060973 RepID=A0A9Q8VBW5_9HYPO|nr:Acetylxylan esterase [Purpureocillium takamizusanense]UNI19294.1 Acetylxylan esterase [Purpureocillium takamizusanense]
MRATSSLALLLAGVAAADPSPNPWRKQHPPVTNKATSTCATGLFVLVARGTTEPQGAGVTGLVAGNITEKIPGSKVQALDYPATFSDPAYQDSVAAGVKSMQSVVNNYLNDCPDGKMAILGYSQGAHVGMDAVCGGSGGVFDAARALPVADIKKNVLAMVFLGDPTHVANVTYDKGTSIKNGLFERNNASVETCKQYSDRLVSYCDTGDTYCDVGKDKKVHGGYVAKYGDEIVKYVVDKYHAAVIGGNATTTTTSATATATTAAPTGSGASSATTTTGAAATGSGTATGAAASATKTGAAAGLSAGKGMYLAPLVMGVAAWAM